MTTLATLSPEALRRTANPSAAPAKPAAWRVEDVEALFALPFMELVFRARQVHREHFDPNAIQLSPCSRSRPADVPRTAATARSRRISTPA